MTKIALPSTTSFVRTRSTWLGYALLACFGFALSLVGPVMPFLAAKMSFTFSQIGYHFTMMSVGIVFISLIGDKVARRIGNDLLAWGAAAFLGFALLGVTFGSSAAVTLFSMYLYGVALGALVLVTFTAITVAAGQHTPKAFAEANIFSAIAGIMGPLVAGLIASSPFGWQAIAFLPLIAVVLLKLFFWGLPMPETLPGQKDASLPAQAAGSRPLPMLFWIFSVLLLLSVGIENLVAAVGATYFTTIVGLNLSTSAAVMSVFSIAGLLGRIIGRRLLDFMPEVWLLTLSLAWVMLTFPIYWLSTLPLLNVAGMFLLGLGASNLSPMCMAGAMTAAGEASNRASARLGLFPPVGLFIMVQIFSFLSDKIGMQRAYTLMIIVVVVAIIITVRANRVVKAKADLQI